MASHPTIKPAVSAEQQILDKIISGEYPSGMPLPSERELAVDLNVTRPTLREVLQRLARDGWLEIHHGKPTLVRKFMEEGSLAILSTLARKVETFPTKMIEQILQVRLLIAPEYTRLAIMSDPAEVEKSLQIIAEGSDDPEVVAKMDHQMQKVLSQLSKNSILALTINEMEELYIKAMSVFYQNAEARKQCRVYFRMVYKAARAGEPDAAEAITRRTMRDNIQLWEAIKNTFIQA